MDFSICPKSKSKKRDWNVEPIGLTEYWYCEDCNTYLTWHDYAP